MSFIQANGFSPMFSDSYFIWRRDQAVSTQVSHNRDLRI
jgi:hypothetical protein